MSSSPPRLNVNPTDPAAQPGYAPISWTAVASLAVAILFVLVLLVTGYMAWRDKQPLLQTWLLVFPAVAVLLAFVARRQIAASEGTRTGQVYATEEIALAELRPGQHSILIAANTATSHGLMEMPLDADARLEPPRFYTSRLATLAMNNVANHLNAQPGVKIVVVANSTGVRAFTFGAQDAGGRPYAEWVDQLKAKGVEFRICQNSMNALKLTQKDLIENLSTVPSGVAEIARLQAKENYVYIHP